MLLDIVLFDCRPGIVIISPEDRIELCVSSPSEKVW